MIIKKVRIKSFGGIKDREFDFKRGVNLINGESEKRTIENFINIWLYGFEDSKYSVSSLRKSFLSSSEEKMQGQLVIEYNGIEYVIQRTFGLTKKDDVLNIYNKLTRKEIDKKEQEKIVKYIQKLKVLEKKEKEIDDYLEKNRGIITKEYVNYLTKENRIYLKILNIKKENEFDLKEIENKIAYQNNKLHNYKFFSSMDDDLKENLTSLSNEQEGLRDKVLLSRRIKFSIEEEERILEQKRKFLGHVFKLTSYKEEIKLLLQDYENKQQKLKEKIEDSNIDKNIDNSSESLEIKNNKFIFLSVLGVLIFIINMISANSIILYLLSIIFIAIGIFFIMNSNKDTEDIGYELNSKDDISSLNQDIKLIEQKLKKYMDIINCDSYEVLSKSIKSLESFYLLEAKTKLKIEKKNIELQQIANINEDEEKYNKNKKVLDSMIKLSGSNTIDDIYIKLDEFEKIKSNLDELYIEYNSKRKVLNKICIELEEKEREIKNNLKIINLEYISLLDLEIYLERFREIV